ncbi:MAG TPA: YdcH family protein [Polyangiaceae bacterium]|jgi:uncharacterized protein YdcH (DUF465 family)|nr:YdcH family protein [Polyangiaceae bacterium]
MKHVSIRELELRGRTLDNEIHRLERRGSHMTPEDRVRASILKKQRLATKDQLFSLRGR